MRTALLTVALLHLLSALAVAESGPVARKLEEVPRIDSQRTDLVAVNEPLVQIAPGQPSSGFVEREPGKKGTRTVRVVGRLAYTRPDGRVVGATHAPFSLKDDEWSVIDWDDYLYEGVCDENGYFDFTFQWDDCFLFCEAPDMYIVSSIGRSWVVDDFEGTFYDFGTLSPSSEDGLLRANVQTTTRRTWVWLAERGYAETAYNSATITDGPSYYDIYFYANQYVYMNYVNKWEAWNDAHIAATAMQHFLHLYSTLWVDDLCNGVCESGLDGCGYCLWCPESYSDAWQRGFGEGIGAIIASGFEARWGLAPYEYNSVESLGDCPLLEDYPERNPGYFAAFLYDAYDVAGDDHPQYPGVRDRMAYPATLLLGVAAASAHTDPIDYIYSLGQSVPSDKPIIWETAANCGLDVDLLGPNTVWNMASITHPVGVPVTATNAVVTWTAAQDNFSGVAGYSVSVTNSPSMPDAIRDIGPVTSYQTEPLFPGDSYLNVRAVDRAGNWGPSFQSYGPMTVVDPTPADLVHEKQSGWADVVIPSGSANASSGSVPLPTTLVGGGNTYWNVAPKNGGGLPVGAITSARVFVDGARYLNILNPSEGGAAVPSLNGHTFVEILNQGPITVRPGRHMFAVNLDDTGQVVEMDEQGNGWGRQWTWMPSIMPLDQWLGTTSLSDRDGGFDWNGGISLWPNCDGRRFYSSGWWNAVYMIANHEDSDYDLRLFPDSSGPTSGFTLPWNVSSRPRGCIDAVIVNVNQTGANENWDVGVLQSDYERQPGGYAYRHVVSSEIAFGDNADQLDPTEALHLREFYVHSTVTGPVSLVLDIDPDDGPLQIAWLDASFDTGGLLDYDAWAMTDEDGRARLDLTIPDPGYHCAVIFRDAKDVDYSTTVPYTLRYETTPPDLRPQFAAGWFAPLVPRPAADATPGNVPAPTALTGWQPATYFNLAQENVGPTDAPGPLATSVRVDDAEILSALVNPGIAATGSYKFNNMGAVEVRGGRHTISLHTDVLDDVTEIHEDNNVYGAQYAWSSIPMSVGSFGGLPQPSPRTAGWQHLPAGVVRWYNCDGWRSPDVDPEGSDIYWAAVALAPSSGGDVDVRLHEANDDPQTAYTDALAFSGWGPEQTDYVLINYYAAHSGSYDVGVLGVSGTGGYRQEFAAGEFTGIGAGTYGPYTLGGGEIVNLHEVWLTAGFYNIQLENRSDAHLGMSLHAFDAAYQGKSDALGTAWLEPAGADQWLTLEVPLSGPHCLAVWKSETPDVTLDSDYVVRFHSITDAPPVGTIARTSIASVAPNPFNARTEVSFAVQHAGDVDLTVYNLRGERVRTLHRGHLEAGEHRRVWDGIDDAGQRVASGVYLVRLTAEDVNDLRKITLLK